VKTPPSYPEACAPIFFPVRNSATVRFSSAVSDAPCAFIVPDSSASTIFSGSIALRTLGAGARVCAELSWQVAH
jgi:hypothetical protein